MKSFAFAILFMAAFVASQPLSQTEKSTQELQTEKPAQEQVQTEKPAQELQTEQPAQELQTEKPAQKLRCGICYTDTCSNATVKLCDNAENCYKVYRNEKTVSMDCFETPRNTFVGAQNTCTKSETGNIVCICSKDMCNMEDFEIKHLRSWFQKFVGWFSE
ncbi:hypothetical protein M3Y97_01137300 [Aphelenchoides bicaudatus]|nr:hypothetical protein M3Y97_01137300 [Aphelenchoides bicaudatus]